MTDTSFCLVFQQENKKEEKCTNYHNIKLEVAGKRIMNKFKLNEIVQEGKLIVKLELNLPGF